VFLVIIQLCIGQQRPGAFVHQNGTLLEICSLGGLDNYWKLPVKIKK